MKTGKGFFIIIREPDRGPWQPSDYPHQHETYADALKEARRLADVAPGSRFYVFQVRASAVRQQPVTVTEFDTDDIPF